MIVSVGRSIAATAWRRRLRALGWGVALPLGWLGLPYAWYRCICLWWLYGGNAPLAWPALMAALSLALIILMRWLTAGREATAPNRWTVAATLAGWFLSSATLWKAVASPLANHAMIALVPTASTIWLLCLWAMFIVSNRWKVRCRALVAALALSAAVTTCARASGIDGAGRPLAQWRFFQPDATHVATHRNLEPHGANRRSHELRYHEYPCFRGRDGLGVVADRRLADWTRRWPRELWRRPVGAGWGAFAVSDGLAFTQEQHGASEAVACYDLGNGRQVWSHTDPGCFRGGTSGDGPRATPNVIGRRVFSLGANGRLNCLEQRTGRRVWSIDVLADNDAGNLSHGVCGSPLVVDGLVVVSAGGRDGKSLAAYDSATGDRVWRAGNDAAGYGSPQLCRLADREQIVILNRSALAGHDWATGRVLWTVPWENSTATNCSQCVPLGQRRLFVSSGYGKGCGALEITTNAEAQWSVRPLWANRNLRTTFTSAVSYGGFLFGLDEGVLCCIDAADGARRWRAGRYGHGQLLLAGDKLVVQAESGEVALVAATPDGHHELARLAALSEKTWNFPALAGNLLLVRNDREAACYELPLDDED